MNVVHLIPYYAPAWGFGGVVRAAHGLTVALAAQGHRVTVITTDAGDGGVRLPAGESSLDGVRVIRCPNVWPALRRLNLSSPRGLGPALRAALADANVLHVHEFRTLENLIALPLARRRNVPVMLSPHGTLSYAAGRTAIKRGWDMLFGRITAAQVNGVSALTAAEAAEVRALWSGLGLLLREDRVVVVPNGVDPAAFAALPPRGEFRARWNVPLDAPLILFLGRLHRRKGVHLLVGALVDLPGAWLAVVGPDEGEGEGLRSLAAGLKVADRVVFTGLLAGPDRLSALAAADVLALPAVGEGQPMVALEAMAAGVPVALSEGCHLPEAVEAGAGVLLRALDAGGVAASLAPLLASADLRCAMGEHGRRLVEAQFTWAAAARQMTMCYSAYADG